MWYTTTLHWQLDFNPAITNLEEIRTLRTLLGQDLRELKETDPVADGLQRKLNESVSKDSKFKSINLSYIDFELTSKLDWIQWDWSEKFYDIVEKTQFIIDYMRHYYPHFGLSGSIECQWEEFEDRWLLVVKDNIATRVDNQLVWYVRCPECDHHFKIN